MGNQDEQQQGSWKPPMSLPSSQGPKRPAGPSRSLPQTPRAARDERPPARATPPPAGRAGGQFRPLLPRFGPNAADASPAEEPVAASWDDRFDARHAPDAPRKTPVRGRTHDDERSFEASDAPAWDDRAYPNEDDAPSDAYGAAEDDRIDDRHYRANRGRPRSQSDPWSREWAEWSRTDLSYEDDLAESSFEDGNWSRQRFGDGPDPFTMASVAIVLHPQSASASAKSAKMPAIKQLARWVQYGFARKYKPTQKAIRVLLVMSMLGIVFLTGAGAGLTAYVDYTSLKGLGTDAVAAFTRLGNDLGLSKGGAVRTIQKSGDARYFAAQADLNRAMNDFQQIHDRLAHPDPILFLGSKVPKIAAIMQSGIALSSIAIDGVSMLQTLLPNVANLANVLNASPIATSTTVENTKLLSGSDITAIAQGIQTITPTLTHMIGLVQATPPNILVAALNAKQQSDILPFLQLVPQMPNALDIVSIVW